MASKSKIDYSVILNSKDQAKKAGLLNGRGANFAEDFNSFVKASLLFWNAEDGGNKNIQIINDLLNIAYSTRGMNASKLMDYCYQAGVVHSDEEDGKGKDKKHFFGAKKKKESYKSMEDMQQFLKDNPNWSEIYEDAGPKFSDPKLDKIKMGFLVQVARGLGVGTITPDEVKALAERLLDEANEKLGEKKVVTWIEEYKKNKAA